MKNFKNHDKLFYITFTKTIFRDKLLSHVQYFITGRLLSKDNSIEKHDHYNL